MTFTRIWIVCAATACGFLLVATLVGPQDGRAQDATDDADSEWPREIDAPNSTIVVYQPQLDGYASGAMEGHAAFAVTRTGEATPVFGAAWLKAKVRTNRETRMCDIYDIEVTKARFPDSTEAEEKGLVDLIQRAVPGAVQPISMDRLLPELEAVEQARANDERLSYAAPRIVVETVPALLVPIDGDAKLGDVAGSRVRRVVNTPVALLFDPSTKTYWIDAGASWIYAADVDGPYRSAGDAPPEIAAVRTSNASGGAGPTKPFAAPGGMPKIVVSHEPTELVAFDGLPQWKAVVDDELFYAANTSAAVFATKSDGRFYVLLSGRWYRGATLQSGPWEFVASDRLPAVFRDIPEDSEVGGVLAHVAGTDLAEEAVLDAQMPQTTAVLRAGTTCVVAYDGAPQFDTVGGTDLKYASNTASQVLLCKGAYYCCDQGVWFSSASPTGPWSVSDAAPAAFQQIPPENPCYNTKFVYVYDSTPDVVYVGYTPGYLGWYAWDGTVVWGTGSRYAGWSGGVWYPRSATWGVSVGYNAWSGRWYEGLALRTGVWSIGVGAFGDGNFGGAWWGPGGYRRWRHEGADSNRPVAYGRTFDRGDAQGVRRRPIDVYDGARNRARNAPDRLASRPVSRPPARPLPPVASGPVRSRDDDTFADRDGQIYRRGRDGAWQVRAGKAWKPAPSATPTPSPRAAATSPHPRRPPAQPAPTPQLGRDARARDRGTERSRGGKRK